MSWRTTIARERSELPGIFEQSPSLLRYARQEFPTCYKQAVARAIDETGLAPSHFAAKCPFTFDEVLATGFLPE